LYSANGGKTAAAATSAAVMTESAAVCAAAFKCFVFGLVLLVDLVFARVSTAAAAASTIADIATVVFLATILTTAVVVVVGSILRSSQPHCDVCCPNHRYGSDSSSVIVHLDVKNKKKKILSWGRYIDNIYIFLRVMWSAICIVLQELLLQIEVYYFWRGAHLNPGGHNGDDLGTEPRVAVEHFHGSPHLPRFRARKHRQLPRARSFSVGYTVQ